MITIVGLLAVIAGVVTSQQVIPVEEFNPVARGSGGVIDLLNANTRGWGRITVLINDVYDCTIRTPLAAGDTLTINTSDCASANGTRFFHGAQKVRRIRISAVMGDDHRLYVATLDMD